jgi:hypothetical protein
VLAGDVRPEPYLFAERQPFLVAPRSVSPRQLGPDADSGGAQQQ